MKRLNNYLNKSIFLLTSLCIAPSYADTATASQHLRIIIPKIALIDTDNTHTPLIIAFDPMTEAGDNFTPATASSSYDVTSNISGLKLYGKINTDLKSNYNLVFQVNARSSIYKELTTNNKRIITVKQLAKMGKTLNYKASVAQPDKTIPYGDINVTVTYTLVEP